ncbi:dienelactone hydrolase family protein [Rivibacter subsaxonicus]|uniref:Carboxymethylenebutenolidase n=1 Tax=Rivibacter subsaxonicus TaxID=457575 RepID=A0A4Q7W1D4_9BURK|nr:dienelactone hydrolase family protein [Rivibacter subsaxonicus]RZU02823.1 carboxymethylenebutenolidase [Rivibacter subsaxonicus]
MLEQEIDKPTATPDYSRRDFVRASVGSGFAAAVMPVTAQTLVSTGSGGLVAGPVTIPVGSFQMPAYRAQPDKPAGKNGFPVVLVISEIFGVHEHIADLTRRLARQGYLAIAPELFIRQGDAKAAVDIPTLVRDVISKVPDAQVMADLDATAAWAAANGGDATRLAATGMCWGGRITWLYAAHNPKIEAAAAWYGRLVGEASALQPKHPIDLVGSLHAPVLGLYAEKDGGIPLDSVDKMKAALAQGSAAARKSEIVVFPGTQHGFLADYRPSFDRQAAEDAWKRMLAWFEARGVA